MTSMVERAVVSRLPSRCSLVTDISPARPANEDAHREGPVGAHCNSLGPGDAVDEDAQRGEEQTTVQLI